MCKEARRNKEEYEEEYLNTLAEATEEFNKEINSKKIELGKLTI